MLSSNLYKPFFRTEKIIQYVQGKSFSGEFSLEVLDYIVHINSLKASLNTHYDVLNEWMEFVLNPVHDHLIRLKSSDCNSSSSDHYYAWAMVYELVNNIHYSPNLFASVLRLKSSADSRSEALVIELNHLISVISLID